MAAAVTMATVWKIYKLTLILWLIGQFQLIKWKSAKFVMGHFSAYIRKVWSLQRINVKSLITHPNKGEGTLWGLFGPVNWAKNRNVDRAYILLILWSQYIGLERCTQIWQFWWRTFGGDVTKSRAKWEKWKIWANIGQFQLHFGCANIERTRRPQIFFVYW